MKISDYALVRVEGADSFVDHVNDLIDKGWTPIGGVSMSILRSLEDDQEVFSQAMVKYESE